MFPTSEVQVILLRCLLRTSGDVSVFKALVDGFTAFAPHERRCFWRMEDCRRPQTVCSARAEVFF